jgi:uncharacterized peroxidase-related enzyme
MYLETIAEEDATGRIAEIYREQKVNFGFLMEADKCWTTRPDLLPLFEAFFKDIKAKFSLGMREWRLITLIAAKQLPSTYCSYVYGRLLVDTLGSKDAVLAVHHDFRNAGLSDQDVAMLEYAEKIAKNASKVIGADIERLRAVGFSDQQICDIALCASLRCFMSRFFDAVGASPEPPFFDSDETFRAAMTVGKRY